MKDFADGMNRYNRQLIFDFFSDIVKIINIVSRNKDFLHPGALCGHEFFRKTADRIDISLKRYFTGHGNCRTDRNAADQRSESSRQGNPGRGTVFGGCTVRNMAAGENPYGAPTTAVTCTNRTATAHLTVRDCRFTGIRGSREDTHYGVFCIADYTTVENCFFTNCWCVTGKDSLVKDRCRGFTFVSNTFFVANSKETKP